MNIVHHEYLEESEEEERLPILNMESMKVISPLGRGAKGVVFLVKEEPLGEFYALKVISRDFVKKKKRGSNDKDIEGEEYRRIYFEQQVLSRFNHPLLPKLRGVLATDKILAYAIDYCPGRDLHFLRKQQSEKMFAIDTIRFYAAELVLALEYLHRLGIAYRDLKPDNIMVQENGHIMLVDFDLSTKLPPKSASPVSLVADRRKRRSPLHRFFNRGVSPDDSGEELGDRLSEPDSTSKSNSFVGTEEYVAPEVIQGDGHDFGVDWWSLGVVLYEMLYGVTPFKGENRKESFYRILTKNPDLVGEATPLRDLIGKLLIKDPKERIGVEGIKGHDFFKGIDWDLLLQILRPPYIPLMDNWNEGEGKDGIKEIDVEIFVQEIFGAGDDDKKKNRDDNHHGNENKKVWVNGLNTNHPCEAENFLVF
ncbi:PREDICTED: serine/threonine-protein kinase OXI1 [Populus euphratica]|uniref:non-specific serine/threonine protein kinase n=1 Tax=Populus euphratica TaxID=75702 RepID=A0AAJ6XMN6_POPEU|nr:PREDICTED: serine/threonine-protein kinase OXI1 [Populus euphratica]